MADNTILNAGTGGDTVRDIDRGSGIKTQVVQLDAGGASGESLISATNPMPVAQQVAISCYRLLSAAASTNATSVKASAGKVRAIQGYNAKTTPVFLKFFDKASTPTVGTDTPVKTLYLPASSAFAFDFSFSFATGIAYALTAAGADADTTALLANDIQCLNIDYV